MLIRYHRLVRCISAAAALLLAAALLTLHLLPLRAQTISAEPFADYYWNHHGERVLGAIQSPVVEINGYRTQFFEKGRLEDRRHEMSDPTQAVAYSALTLELIEMAPDLPVAGLPFTYGEIAARMPGQYPPPPGFSGGVMQVEEGIFIPATPDLSVGSGYLVPFQIWTYMNRAYLFPRGWQQDIGRPLSNAFDVVVSNPDGSSTTLIVQPFERTVLALDLSDAYGWPVQRLNIGTDAIWVYGSQPLYQQHAPAPPREPAGEKRVEVSLDRQWLYAYEGERLVLDVPVSTGKDGFNTPPGSWRVYAKVPRQTLRGRYNGESWHVPNVPHIQFYDGNFAIHGVYWHDRFGTGERHSHGCVGIAPADAAELFLWTEIGTPVTVY
jgi:hypothetical protein